MREEGEARCRPGLHGVAHEVAIEIEHRREVRREECCADPMRSRRRREAGAHRRAAAAAEERFGALLSTGRRRAAAGGPAPARGSAPALPRRALASAVRLRRAETTAALPVDERLTLAVEQYLEL